MCIVQHILLSYTYLHLSIEICPISLSVSCAQAVEAERAASAAGAGASQEDPGRDPQYAEPAVDAARAQRTRSSSACGARRTGSCAELAQQAQTEGVFIL